MLHLQACKEALRLQATFLVQVGEYDLVVAMGTKLLEKWESRGFRRDILLSMALAQCGLATDTFAVQQVGKGTTTDSVSVGLQLMSVPQKTVHNVWLAWQDFMSSLSSSQSCESSSGAARECSMP